MGTDATPGKSFVDGLDLEGNSPHLGDPIDRQWQPIDEAPLHIDEAGILELPHMG